MGPIRRIVRVFVSSTFRDMHAERDYLNRIVFPELRSRCRKRGVEFIGLDLRWGVTEEEAQRQGALKICLDEIERCRPFFVCLLGDRFGWVPPPEEIPGDLFEQVKKGGQFSAEMSNWYQLDQSNIPSLYRLRRDQPLSSDLAQTLARFWESHGLPHAGESITAREIIRGLLEPGFPPTHALFYLRTGGIEKQADFPKVFASVFAEADTGQRRKLDDLKTLIRQRSDQTIVRDYEVHYAGIQIDPNFLPTGLSDEELAWVRTGIIAPNLVARLKGPLLESVEKHGTIALSGLEAIGQRILDDLWAAIERELEQPGEQLDNHQRERAYHERFIVDRTRLFLGRQELVDRALAYIDDTSDSQPLIFAGDPGCGKSALLAAIAKVHREQSPRTLVVPHFIGASPGSAILANTLRSICETLRRECDLVEEVPQKSDPDGEKQPPEIRPMEVADDPIKLRQKWLAFLEKAGAVRPIVLLLDAVNQLDPLDKSHELFWFPFQLPKGVKLIASTLAGDCLDRFRRRLPVDHIIDIQPLFDHDLRALVEKHLDARRKKLSEEQLTCLLDMQKRPDIGLPLYLLVALEELCMFGSFEALTDRIDRLPPTIADLFDQVLARLEHDHGRDMSASICRWLAASRSGMLESEILDLLGGNKFPRVRWTRFYRSIEAYLRPVEETTGAGLLDFYHDQLRLAAYRRYLGMQSVEVQPTDASREAHSELTQYFRSIAIKEDSEFPEWRWEAVRGLSELPYHQLSAEMWNALEKTLTDLGFVEAKSRTGMVHDLLRDYAAAEWAWPGSSELERQVRIAEYNRALIEYSSAHSLCRDPAVITIPLPVPPRSVARADKPQNRNKKSFWTPLERIQSWALFVAAYSVGLTSGEEAAFQIAYNSADCGPVVEAAQRFSTFGCNPRRAWLRLLTRSPFTLKPAYVKSLEGHLWPIHAVALTSDGRRAVSGAEGGELRVWDLVTGESRALEGHFGSVNSVALTPDGRCALSGGDDQMLRVWNLMTGESHAFAGHSHSVRAVALTPDGKHAVSGADNAELRVWDLVTGKSHALAGLSYSVKAVALTPDGRHVVSGGEDESLRVWDLNTGLTRVFDTKVGPVTTTRIFQDGATWDHRLFYSVLAMAVTLDGKRALTGIHTESELRVWELETGENRILKGAGNSEVIALTSDGRHVVTEQGSGLGLYDLETGKSRVLYGDRNSRVKAIALTVDGRYAISGSDDKTLQVWDLEADMKPAREVHTGELTTIYITPDRKRVISADNDGKVLVWNLETGHYRVLKGKRHDEFAHALVVTRDGTRAVGCSEDNRLRVWNIKTGRMRALGEPIVDYHEMVYGERRDKKCRDDDNDIESVVIGADDRHVFSRTRNGTICLWDLCVGKMGALKRVSPNAESFTPTPDGRLVVFGNRELGVWDLGSGETRILGQNKSICRRIALTPDSMNAISYTEDGRINVWNLQGGGSRMLEGDVGLIHALAIAPDGRRVFSAGNDGALRVWDLRTGQSYALNGHTGPIRTLAITPDGRNAFSGGDDAMLRVWDLDSGRIVLTRRMFGPLTNASLNHPIIVIGEKGDRVVFLSAEDYPLTAPLYATCSRLWFAHGGYSRRFHERLLNAVCTGYEDLVHGHRTVPGYWDDRLTAMCQHYGKSFPVPSVVLNAIESISRSTSLDPDDSPCLTLPTEAWDEPRLLSECPFCHEPIKYNPFIVDNRDRLNEQRLDERHVLRKPIASMRVENAPNSGRRTLITPDQQRSLFAGAGLNVLITMFSMVLVYVLLVGHLPWIARIVIGTIYGSGLSIGLLGWTVLRRGLVKFTDLITGIIMAVVIGTALHPVDSIWISVWPQFFIGLNNPLIRVVSIIVKGGIVLLTVILMTSRRFRKQKRKIRRMHLERRERLGFAAVLMLVVSSPAPLSGILFCIGLLMAWGFRSKDV